MMDIREMARTSEISGLPHGDVLSLIAEVEGLRLALKYYADRSEDAGHFNGVAKAALR